MKKKLKQVKILGFLLSIMVLLYNINIVNYANEYWPEEVSAESTSAIVMEQQTGTILYAKNIDEELYPASITKIMTALVILENCDLNETVTFSQLAVSQEQGGTSSIARDVNEKMTVEETLYGMMLESANECAWALAEHCSGSVEEFSELMNKKAKELGCTHTHFSNPNGLHGDDHYTSAHDMALISRAAFNNPKFAEIAGTKNYSIGPTNKHSEDTYLNNHHQMLHYYKTTKYLYEYCLGGKTGYTTQAGNTLVTYARKNGMTLVCVVMKAPQTVHYTDTRTLFDYCFDNFGVYNVSENTSIANKSISNNEGTLSDNIDLIKIDREGIVVLPKTASINDATSKVEPYKDPTNLSTVGRIIYTYSGREVGSANLIFESSNEPSYPFDNIPKEEGGSGKEYIQVNYLRIIIIILAVIAAIALTVFIHSKIGAILLFKYRHIDQKRKPKTDFKKIRRKNTRKRRRRFF